MACQSKESQPSFFGLGGCSAKAGGGGAAAGGAEICSGATKGRAFVLAARLKARGLGADVKAGGGETVKGGFNATGLPDAVDWGVVVAVEIVKSAAVEVDSPSTDPLLFEAVPPLVNAAASGKGKECNMLSQLLPEAAVMA